MLVERRHNRAHAGSWQGPEHWQNSSPSKSPVQPFLSRARKEGAQWITKRPDADNLAKILADAMNKIVYVDDAQVASLIVQKRYGEFCRVTVSVIDLEGAA